MPPVVQIIDPKKIQNEKYEILISPNHRFHETQTSLLFWMPLAMKFSLPAVLITVEANTRACALACERIRLHTYSHQGEYHPNGCPPTGELLVIDRLFLQTIEGGPILVRFSLCSSEDIFKFFSKACAFVNLCPFGWPVISAHDPPPRKLLFFTLRFKNMGPGGWLMPGSPVLRLCFSHVLALAMGTGGWVFCARIFD